MTSSAHVRGDVVQLDFPFADAEGGKDRPALVVAGPNTHGDYVVVMMSREKHDDGVPIDSPDFASGGLKGAGFARVKRLYTINGTAFSLKRGSLKPGALQRVQAALCPALGCKS